MCKYIKSQIKKSYEGVFMKKSISFLSVFIVLMALQLLSHGCSPPDTAIPRKVLSEEALFQAAVDLAAAEVDYFKIRKKGEWEKIYECQTAYYHQKVSLEEFIFHGGKIRPDWKKDIHISGKIVEAPAMREFIEKKNLDTRLLKAVAGWVSRKQSFGLMIKFRSVRMENTGGLFSRLMY